MRPRQIRRAAERQQRKQERQAANRFVFSPENSNTASDAQLAANRANSQLSTGPKTQEGKANSSLNAVKSALTGRTVLLPTDDAAVYEHHVASYFQELHTVGLRETALVQALADTAWRLDRIPVLEMAIYAQGRIQFAQQFEKEDAALRPRLIELHTYLAYEKQLRNLHLQEMRLRRQREKDTAELRQLQQERTKPEPIPSPERERGIIPQPLDDNYLILRNVNSEAAAQRSVKSPLVTAPPLFQSHLREWSCHRINARRR